jgi:hypothetical protein
MKALPACDFRAKRLMLERKDFAIAPGRYSGPTDLIQKNTWRTIISLPDDVSIRTSDRYGSQLKQMEEYSGIWGRVVLAVQALSKNPRKSPLAIAACDAADEFQASMYCALVGYYRVAFSCLRNVLEQMTIAMRLAVITDPKSFADWRNTETRIGFGWAADTLRKAAEVVAVEQHLKTATRDSLFAQNPKGFVRRLFGQLSKYTHGTTGFTDADFRQSNGPILVPQAFLAWHAATVKTYVIALHELKLGESRLRELPYGPPSVTLDEFRRKVLTDLSKRDRDSRFLQSLAKFWP